jgi:acetyl-CoA carboxylase carboxyltransferase component
VNNVADTEEDAFDQIREFLSYMPQNVWELPERFHSEDDPNRADEALLDIVPKDSRIPFEMRDLIRHVVDDGHFFEISPFYGQGQITGFARLDGAVVGIIANDCKHFAGAMTATGFAKRPSA